MTRDRNRWGQRFRARLTPSVVKLTLTAALLTFASAEAQAPLDIRIALVIGNGAYPGAAALRNPTNDARAMADTLKQLGFSVVELRDGNKLQISEAIGKVRDALKSAESPQAFVQTLRDAEAKYL